jgi:tetratricopeptide (TPR) repeat protein
MSSSPYGQSPAQAAIRQGRYDEAIAEATRAIERDPDDPEPLVERAAALGCVGRHLEAASDLEAALKLDARAGVLDLDAVDDAYFSALLEAAKAEAVTSVPAGVRRLDRYREVFERGVHLRDATDWQKRLRGELKSEFVKEHRD